MSRQTRAMRQSIFEGAMFSGVIVRKHKVVGQNIGYRCCPLEIRSPVSLLSMNDGSGSSGRECFCGTSGEVQRIWRCGRGRQLSEPIAL